MISGILFVLVGLWGDCNCMCFERSAGEERVYLRWLKMFVVSQVLIIFGGVLIGMDLAQYK